MQCAQKVDKDTWMKAAYAGLQPEWLRDLDDEQWDEFYDMYCSTPMAPGEQLESASPSDVSFWPMHPTMERLLIYTRLAWPFEDAAWAGERLCLYGEDTDCRGHNAFDLTSFAAHVRGHDGSYKYAYLTNAEVFDLMAPGNYSLDYVYDNFEWPHCDDQFGNAVPSVDDKEAIKMARDALSGGGKPPTGLLFDPTWR